MTSAVERPAAKISWSISSGASFSSAPTRPRERALASSLSRPMPRPSSVTEMTMRPARCSAISLIVPSGGLAGGDAVFRRLQPVIHRVADHMGQRISQFLDDRLVDLGVLALEHEAHFLAERLGQFADEARHALEHGLNRLRAHRHDVVLQLAGLARERQDAFGGLGVDVVGPRTDAFDEHGLSDDDLTHQVHQLVDAVEIDADADGLTLARGCGVVGRRAGRRLGRGRCFGGGLRSRRGRSRLDVGLRGRGRGRAELGKDGREIGRNRAGNLAAGCGGGGLGGRGRSGGCGGGLRQNLDLEFFGRQREVEAARDLLDRELRPHRHDEAHEAV